MSKQEKIVCAAIKIEWFDGYHKRSTYFLGVDYKIIRNDAVYEMFLDDYKFLSETDGFITNKNRFVDPREAMKIAVESEQLEGFLNANYWDGFCSGRGDPETSCKELADEYLKRELKPEDLY